MRLLAIIALVLTVSGASACRRSEAPPAPNPGVALADSAPEPRIEALRAELAGVRATLGAAGGALEEARRAGTLAAARAASERAVHALSASAALGGDLDGNGDVARAPVTPFFPGTERAGGDLLTRTLAVGRAAGPVGVRVVAVLQDPVAGNVTSWERRPDERMTLIEGAVSRGSEDAIGALDGQATRALAWALLAVRAQELDAARGYAERGAAHLAVAATAIDRARPDGPAPPRGP